ncbi:hypothetical protein AB0D37_43605 [Streptomyces sp. NPDC048384]|uniref:hypothetical protein n=1 Tax=Streptomyces sp. NPDC048384 TaxID=3155487 RepID=UPI00343E9B7F
MKFSTKLAVAVPGVLLAGVVAASPAFAVDTPPMSTPPMSTPPMSTPPASSTVVGGDQLSGFGHTHLGSGSGHSLGNISHSIIVTMAPPIYCQPPTFPIEVNGNWTCQ